MVFYEIHQVESSFFQQYSQLFLEYKVLTYSMRIRIRRDSFDELNGRILINKVRLYYFFSKYRFGLQQYLENDGVISFKKF
jgi:hypothetical protein